MKPSIGRIVHYITQNKKIIPAIIVAVWSDNCVNLRLFHDGSNTGVWGDEWTTSKLYDGSEIPQSLTWHWPPKV